MKHKTVQNVVPSSVIIHIVDSVTCSCSTRFCFPCFLFVLFFFILCNLFFCPEEGTDSSFTVVNTFGDVQAKNAITYHKIPVRKGTHFVYNLILNVISLCINY